MARQVSGTGIQIEQKPDTINRRVSGTGILVEEKPTPNKRSVSSAGIMVEYFIEVKKANIESLGVMNEWENYYYRRIESMGVMVEWNIPQDRLIESVGEMLEWREFEYRRLDSIGTVIEYDGPIIPISGIATGSSTVTGNLVNASPVYKMSTGDFRIQGTLTGNIYIQVTTLYQGFINGTLFGKLKLSGDIDDNILNTSYLWNLEKLKTLSFGLLNISNNLDCFLHLNGYTLDNANVPINNVFGFGHLHGIEEGETYFTVRVNGIVPVSFYGFIYTPVEAGFSLTFNQTSIISEVHNHLFTFNGKQLVFPV
jgi:hypothetical protein